MLKLPASMRWLLANLEVRGFPLTFSNDPSRVSKEAVVTAIMEELAQEVLVMPRQAKSAFQEFWLKGMPFVQWGGGNRDDEMSWNDQR